MSIRLSVAAVLAALVVLLSPIASAQAPYVVTTLGAPSQGSSNPSRFTPVGDAIYFYASPDYDNPAIWKWTAANGATRVRTVTTASATSLMAFGDKLLFAAQVDSRGNELWITDGTTTTMVKDIYTGGSSTPVLGAVVGTKAFFTAFHPDSGRELWVTDGTEAGTMMVKDLSGDSASSFITSFATANGSAYFTALDQLWVSDGTEAGTVALASGVIGTRPGVLNGDVVFLGSDNTNGRELWSTDGTPAGTAMLKDINAGAASSWGGIPTTFVEANGVLFFFAEDAANGRELWSTDGTAAGTHLVKDVTPGSASTDLDSLQASQTGAFFLVGKTALWFTDGTEGGTIEVDSYPEGIGSMMTATNGAYLVTKEPALYFSNGTPAGTIEITNVTPLPTPQFAANGGTMIFSGTDGSSGYEPWISDGSEAGTEMLADVSAATLYYNGPTWMSAAGSNVFIANGQALFRSDGTAAGTYEVGLLDTQTYYYGTPTPAALGSTLLFQGQGGLWKSNGTVAGTTLVKAFHDIERIYASSGGYGLLVATESNTYDSTRLWLTNGTGAGTIQLTSRNSSHFVDIAGRTYFLAKNFGCCSEQWNELWRTDGTEASTRLVITGSFSAAGTAGGALYLSAHDTPHGRELWKTDGTADTMTLVRDIKPGTGSSDPANFVAVGNLLFFTADDGTHGRELWRTDGTEAGTFMLADIRFGASSSWSTGLVAVGNYVYFTADDDNSGADLWRTDGTTGGTIRLTSNPSSVSWSWLTSFDGRLLSTGYDPAHGTELWESNGTAGSTYLFADLTAGTASSDPRHLTLARDLLFFYTPDGTKLWALPRAATRVSIDDRRVIEGDAGTAVVQFTVTRSGNVSGSSSVTYATQNISATAGSDYQTASGMVTFTAGQTTQQIAITINGDTTLEANESFAVNLTGATGAVITDDRAVGVIEENDRRVELSVQYVPMFTSQYNNAQRKFRITNSGPSGATVTLKVAESPFDGEFSCDGKNPSVCSVGFVPAGGSVDVTISRDHSTALYDLANVPGRTLTASVSALEPETDLSDNSIARMISITGSVSLPSFLIAGSTTSAQATTVTGYFPSSVQLTLSGGVVVSPASATVTQNAPVATFGVTVSANAWGWSTVKGNSASIMRIPIVLDGEQPKLDTTIVIPPNNWGTWEFEHDEQITIPVTVAAMLPDGTRPTGTVTLFKESDGTHLQTLPIDADGKATFTLAPQPIGEHEYRVAYNGNTYFNPVTVELPQVRVYGFSTSTQIMIATNPCGESEITVTVYNYTDDVTPTGTVKINIGGTEIANLALVPTGTDGSASVTVYYAFTSFASVNAVYTPNPPFQGSSGWDYPDNLGSCPAPTLIASAASASSVSLIWSDVEATDYAIMRAEAPSRTLFTQVGTTTASTFVDTTALPGKSYLYKVHARASGSVIRSTSNEDLATTVIFSDDPIVFRTTRIKAAHIAEIQQAANALRTLAGLAPVTFTPPTSGSPFVTTHVLTLRTALSEALNILGYPVSWVSGVASGQHVKVLHIQQLRNVVK